MARMDHGSGESGGDKVPGRGDWVSFWALVVFQIQSAFHINASKFLLIPLGAWLFAREGGIKDVEHIVAALLVLPYIVFAPTCGWLADRFSRTAVIRWTGWMQLAVLVMMWYSLWMRHLPWALACYFLLALQAAFLSPAKMGVVKDWLGSARLGFASGIMEGTVILAILGGQIGGGLWFDKLGLAHGQDGWRAAQVPLGILCASAVVAVGVSMLLRRTPPAGAPGFSWSLAVRHLTDSREVWRDVSLRVSVLGVAFFWGFGGFVNLVVIQVARALHSGGEGTGSTISALMACASFGIAAGSVVAGLKSRRHVDWGLVPIGALVMAGSLFALTVAPPAHWLFDVLLACAGAGAAAFLVPLNAHVQDHPPADRRGAVLAVSNLFNNLAGVLAVLGQFAMAASGVPVGVQFLIVGVLALVVGWFSMWRHGPDMVRSIAVPLIRMLYRMRVTGDDRIPAKGGLLLLSNHIGFADAFLVSAACPRRVRFVMDQAFRKNLAVRMFTNLFDTVAIAGDRPRAAIRAAIRALREGDVLCVFPEGQISRTGTLNELKHGYELIARGAGRPVVPVWLDGVWGSLFSFEGGSFFRKRAHWPPPRVVVGFGEALDPERAGPEMVTAALRRQSAECLRQRLILQGDGEVAGAGGARWRALANGVQLAGVNALPWKGEFAWWRDDPEAAGLESVWEAFAARCGARAVVLDAASMPAPEVPVVGGAVARDRLRAGAGKRRFYDFSDGAVPVETERFPCHAVAGVVVAVSMPDPPLALETSLPQAGRRAGAVGRLLPGIVAMTLAGGRLRLEGPSLPDEGVVLPAGSRIDGEGFLFVAGREGAG